MRLSLVTDAWRPQVNGVVTTLQHTVASLRLRGVEVDVVTPEGMATWSRVVGRLRDRSA